jgi:riboflavin kinase/FMN adenylyltransferase
VVQPRRIDGARSLVKSVKGSLIAIGNFDGVHAGHRAVLTRAMQTARDRGLAAVVLTFNPHPSEVLGRGGLPVLTPLERKVELLCRLDPELSVVVQPFTPELAGTSPREFAEGLLARDLGARVVVVGQNFRFGKDRAGDLKMLEELGKSLDFEARAEPLAADADGTFSSSRIRARIADGDVEGARRLLGRPHALSGTVVKGDGRGRTIGVPTANLDGVAEALPPHGVYACLVDRVDGPSNATRLSTGVANIGNRPTFGAGFSVEAHLHDFAGDLYGARLRVHLVERIRPEMKFSGVDELVGRIRADIDTARRMTEHEKPAPAALGAWS